MSDPGREQSGHYLYAVSVACSVCHEVTQFVEITDAPVPLDQEVPLRSKGHCPNCGVALREAGEEWDLREEYEIETVTPTQESDRDD